MRKKVCITCLGCGRKTTLHFTNGKDSTPAQFAAAITAIDDTTGMTRARCRDCGQSIEAVVADDEDSIILP